MDSDGSNPVNVTHHPRKDDEMPAWSPDGVLVFSRYGCLMVFTPETGDWQQITQGVCADHFPDWARGLRSAYSDACNPTIAFVDERAGRSDIFLVQSDSDEPVLLTSNAAAEKDLAWSPQGDRLAYCTDRDGNEEIYLMAADGTGLFNLSVNPGPDCRWHGDWTVTASPSFRNATINRRASTS